MKLKYVTITGADNNTDPDDLIELSKIYPFVEWGILFSTTRNLKGEARYPTIDWVKQLKEKSKGLNMKFSAHLCGGYTTEILEHGTADLAHNNIKSYIINFFDRAQLNFNATKHIVNEKFYDLLKTSPHNHNLIIQYNKANAAVCKKIIDQNIPVHFLYDSSGGRGTTIEYIHPIIPNHLTGYAGGLSPVNIQEALDKIEDANGNTQLFKQCWIDTESGVRTDDKLDLDKVVSFLEIAKPYTI